MSKFALCLQGGGSRGAYGSGALDVLMENGFWADEVIGTSAGALIGCNYISRDKGRSDNMMLKLMSDRHFFQPLNFFRKGSIFDFHYMVYDVSEKGLSFDFVQFAKNPCRFYAVSTSCLTGEPRYFEKGDSEFWNALASSASLPFTSKPVLVHGEPCLDGGVVCPIGFEKALEDAYGKVVVISTREKGFRKAKMKDSQFLLAKGMYHDYPVFLETYRRNDEIYNAQMERLDFLADSGGAFVLYPSVAPKVSRASKSKRKIQELIDLGKKDMETQLSFLKEYLSK